MHLKDDKMSEEKQLDEVLGWFNSRISSSVSGYRNSANKHLRVIMDRIEEVKTAAHRFDYSDIKDPDVYQNYATTIYNKTLELFEEIMPPENITYNNLESFNSDTKNKISSYINILSKYLSWLKRDRSYKTKVKTLDRSLTRLKEEIQTFENKTLLSYAEIIKFERVEDDINSLITSVERKQHLEVEIETHADDVEKITKNIVKAETELNELKNHPGFQQLKKNTKELEHIEISISNKVSEIKKLGSKVLRATDSRKVELGDTDKDTLKTLIKDPMGALVKDREGYNDIKYTLRTLIEISKSPAIQMKKEKLQRAYENIEEILDNALLDSQKRAKFLLEQSDAINLKFKDMQLYIRIKKLENEVGNLKIDRNRITLSLRRELDELDSKIKTLTKSIEERIKEFTSRTVKLVF